MATIRHDDPFKIKLTVQQREDFLDQHCLISKDKKGQYWQSLPGQKNPDKVKVEVKLPAEPTLTQLYDFVFQNGYERGEQDGQREIRTTVMAAMGLDDVFNLINQRLDALE